MNGVEDGHLLAISDSSMLSLESIFGEKSQFYDDGLYQGSVGILADGPNGAFVATSSPTAVPEPNSFALMALGGLSLAGYHWRKRRKRQLAANE